jgi:hypothetical protein
LPNIPHAADEIEVVRAAMRNLDELRRDAGLNLMQIAHLLDLPMC